MYVKAAQRRTSNFLLFSGKAFVGNIAGDAIENSSNDNGEHILFFSRANVCIQKKKRVNGKRYLLFDAEFSYPARFMLSYLRRCCLNESLLC